MRSRQVFSVILFVLLSTLPSSAAQQTEQPPPRDPRAAAVLTQSVAALGGVVPTDSVATGSIELVAGSKTESGKIRILTRGVSQTSEEIETPDSRRALVYSGGLATEKEGTSAKRLQLELAVTTQSSAWPLVIFSAALSSADTAFEYVGEEKLDGSLAHHIRISKTFPAKPGLEHLAEFSATDAWIDAVSGLPLKLAYFRREAKGAAPKIPVEVFFSDYRKVNGVLYPFLIKKSVNGTPWATIKIEEVLLNTGLSEAEFALR